MGKLWEKIRAAVNNERVIASDHADDQMRVRHIKMWQVIAEIDNAQVKETRPRDLPNPTVVVEQSLPDGTPVRVVWAWLRGSGWAKLITVHFLD